MGYSQKAELEKHGVYLSVPHGVSMWPMLRDRKDVVEVHRVEGQLKRYDLVVYLRGNGQGVIHRVHAFRAGCYVINGDNCWHREIVEPEQIIGLVKRFCRKGVWHDVTDWRYLVYAHVWTDFYWLRYPLFRARDSLKRRLGALRRKT